MKTLLALRAKFANHLSVTRHDSSAFAKTSCFAITGNTALSIYLKMRIQTIKVYLQEGIEVDPKTGEPRCTDLFKAKFKQFIKLFIKSQQKEDIRVNVESYGNKFLIKINDNNDETSIQVKFDYWPKNQTIHQLLEPSQTSLNRIVYCPEEAKLQISEFNEFRDLEEFNRQKGNFPLEPTNPKQKLADPKELLETLDFANRINIEFNRTLIYKTEEFCDLIGKTFRQVFSQPAGDQILRQDLQTLVESEHWKKNFNDLGAYKALKISMPQIISEKYPTFKPIPFRKSVYTRILNDAEDWMNSQEFRSLLYADQDEYFGEVAHWRLLSIVVGSVGDFLEFRESRPHLHHLLKVFLGDQKCDQIFKVISGEKDNTQIELFIQKITNLKLNDLFNFINCGKEFITSNTPTKLTEDDSLILDIDPIDDSHLHLIHEELEASFMTEAMMFSTAESGTQCWSSTILPSNLNRTATSNSTTNQRSSGPTRWPASTA